MESPIDLAGLPLQWRKAQQSVNNGACVEVAPFVGGVAVRDSKNPDGPAIFCAAPVWRSFLNGVKAGQYDDFC